MLRRPPRSGSRSATWSQFADRGYARTTLRSIADVANVHPALLHHHFGTKQQLYRAALDLPEDPTEVLDRLLAETPREQFAEALARYVISTWRDPETGPQLRAMTRQNLADPEGTEPSGPTGN